MSHLTTCEDSHSATSSPGLASGPIPSASPDGQTINQCGQAPARASLSARQAKEMGLLTSGTYGLLSSTSSASADLSMSLASNLQALTQITGSTLYKQTWKQWDMPSGRVRFRLRASAHRTSVTELTGWPTPTASNTKNAYQDAQKVIARRLAGRQSNLQDFACLAGWPTPAARDHKGGYLGGRMRNGKLSTDTLDVVAQIAGPLRLTVFGEMRTGSFVEMGNGVQLNPAHSRWLQGLPKAWDTASPHYEQWQAATAQADLRVTEMP